MSIVRWDPFRELEDVSDRLSRMIARPRNGNGAEQAALADWMPAVDIAETPSEYLLKVELPEMKKEDIKIHIENNVLSLEGERKLEREQSGKKFHRMERSYGRFMRSFGLPENVDSTKVRADYQEGVLAVHIAKTPLPGAKAIDIKVS